MANLNITEYSGVIATGAQVVQLPPIATQNVALTTTSAQSAALNVATRMVRLQTDTNCFVEAGANPTALTTSLPLTAGQSEYFGVTPGLKIAART